MSDYTKCGKCGGEGIFKEGGGLLSGWVVCSTCGGAAPTPEWSVTQRRHRMRRENAITLAIVQGVSARAYDEFKWVDVNSIAKEAKEAVEAQDAAWQKCFKDKI